MVSKAKQRLKPLVAIALLFSSSVVAEPERVEKDNFAFGFSFGFGGSETPVTGSSNVITPVVPHIRYYTDKFYFDDFSLGYNLYENDWLLVDVATTFNQDGFYFELNGISQFFVDPGIRDNPRPWQNTDPALVPTKEIKRNLSYLGGIAVIAPLRYATITAAVFSDISGVHNGQEVRFNVRSDYAVDNWTLSGEIGAIYKSAEITRYYYNPRNDELPVRSELPIAPVHAINAYLQLGASYHMADDLSFDTYVTYHRLDEHLDESPVIDSTELISGFIGFTFWY